MIARFLAGAENRLLTQSVGQLIRCADKSCPYGRNRKRFGMRLRCADQSCPYGLYRNLLQASLVGRFFMPECAELSPL